MSERLDIHLSDDAYAALCRKADATGITPSQLAARTLEEEFSGSSVPQSGQGPCSDRSGQSQHRRRPGQGVRGGR
jgi:hypothetical protein